MTEKEKIHQEDELIRQMMQSTQVSAPENLKHRIMQQIQTENALTPKRVKLKNESSTVLKDFKAIFGIMYLLVFGISVFSVISNGTQSLISQQFICTVLLIQIVFTSFWAITRLDAHLRRRRKSE